LIVSGGWDNTLRTWDLETKQLAQGIMVLMALLTVGLVSLLVETAKAIQNSGW
jgi:WD40 repeat protein